MVNLKNVSDAQTIAIKLVGVSDGTNTNGVSIQMGVLIGNATGNGSVSASDNWANQSRFRAINHRF